MAGRGRGREPMKMLRRPLNFEEGYLSKALTELSLIEMEASEMATVESEVKKMATSNENLKKAISLIYKYSHQSKRHAIVGALLFKKLVDLKVDDTSARKILLSMMQTDFKGVDGEIADPVKFLIEVTFLCEIFRNLRVCGSPVSCLGYAVLDYFERLLDGNQEEFNILFEQFQKCVEDLKEVCHAQFSKFMLKVRKKLIIDTSLTIASKALLLVLLECSFTDNISLEPEVVELYEKMSGVQLNG